MSSSASFRTRRRRRPRGFVVLLVLSVVLAISIIAAIGLDRRTDDLSFEGRTLCRVAAHSAAESALARAQARLDAGLRPDALTRGTLVGGDPRAEVTYEARYTGTAASAKLVAEGTCTRRDAPALTRRIEAELELEGGRWVVRRWAE